MTRTEVIALLRDILFEGDLIHNSFTGRVDASKSIRAELAIEAAIDAINRPVKIEVWSDGEQRVSASPLIEVRIHNYNRYGRYDI